MIECDEFCEFLFKNCCELKILNFIKKTIYYLFYRYDGYTVSLIFDYFIKNKWRRKYLIDFLFDSKVYMI